MVNCEDCFHMRGKLPVHKKEGKLLYSYYTCSCTEGQLFNTYKNADRIFNYGSAKARRYQFKLWERLECSLFKSMDDNE